MKTKTINISLPSGLYTEAKKQQKQYHYTSVSELIRDALRWWLNPRLTRNGFTPEFEKEILEAAREPIEDSVKWDGKTPFGKFVLTHPPRKHAKHSIHRKLSHRLSKTRRERFDTGRYGEPVRPMV